MCINLYLKETFKKLSKYNPSFVIIFAQLDFAITKFLKAILNLGDQMLFLFVQNRVVNN